MSTVKASSDLKANSHKTLIKFLVFQLGTLTLGVPILRVQKIVKEHDLYGSGLSHVNLAHVQDHEVAIVDLHKKLFGESLASKATPGYFIICKRIAGEPLGIFTPQAPTLVDIDQEQIRLLPNSYRSADTLEIASHVTIINDSEITLPGESTTIFILDMEKLV